MIRRLPALRTACLTGLVVVAVATGIVPAAGTPAPLSVTPTTTPVVVQGVATLLTGMAVNDALPDDDLAVTVATDHGTVQVDTSSGISLAYGNPATGASVSFSGNPAQVNAALAATVLTTPADSSDPTATVTLTAYPQQADVVYGAVTGHFYRFVPAKQTWDDARSLALASTFLGEAGYLATITTQAENDLVASRIQGAKNVWIGAHAVSDVDHPRDWRWADGPEHDWLIDRCSIATGPCVFDLPHPAYSSWGASEPNNSFYGGEWVAVTNWQYSEPGEWNDVANTADTDGYVVEYGDAAPSFSGVSTASTSVSILAVPGAPTAVWAAAGPERAEVFFTAPSSAGDAPIVSYLATASPGGATATCATSPCSISGLTAWTPYTFTVAAISSLGAGPASAASAPVTPVPQASAPSVVSGVTPQLLVNVAASTTFTADGYPAPTFAVTAGSVPAGMSMTSSGVLSGTPVTVGSWSATITAANPHGSVSRVISGHVGIPPSTPTALTAAPGDDEATVTFQAPANDGGSPVTSYEVRVDAGGWQPLAVTVDGSTVHGVVTGLTNGVEAELWVRALNVVGAGPASGSVTVTPVAAPVAPVAAPTAAAGTSSVTVTWLASTAPDVTGYTVTASPGPATCTVGAGRTSCVIGAAAGRPVAFTVVAHSLRGDSAPSQPSAAVVPTSPVVLDAPPATAPATLTTSEGDISSVRTGETLTVIGTGFASFSTATVVIYSTPRVLGAVVTDAAGSFSLTVTVPADLEAGTHTFVAYGVDTSGDAYAMRLPVEVPTSSTALARTGADPLPLALLTLLLLGAGASLRVASSTRLRRSRVRLHR